MRPNGAFYRRVTKTWVWYFCGATMGQCTGPAPEACRTGVDCDRAKWQEEDGRRSETFNNNFRDKFDGQGTSDTTSIQDECRLVRIHVG